MHTLLVLVGHKRSGKDSVYKLLASLAKFYHRFSFADELKKEVADKLGFTVEEIEEQKPLWRPFLQWYGTEFTKQICNNKDKWCHLLEEEIESRLPIGHIGIITDCRFQHEADFLQARFNCYFVKVERDITTSDNHASEAEIKSMPCDYTVSNYGNLDDLRYETLDLHCAFGSWFSNLHGSNSPSI